MKTMKDFKRDFDEIRTTANEGGFSDEKAQLASKRLMDLVKSDYMHLSMEIIQFFEELMKKNMMFAALDDILGGVIPDCGNPKCTGCAARREEKDTEKKPEIKKRDGEDNVYQFPDNGSVH